MGAGVAPAGRVTCRVEVVAEETVPFTAPKYTMLAAGVELKPEPEMIIVDPGTAESGEKLWIAGCAKASLYKKS